MRQLTIIDTEGNTTRFHFADIITSATTLLVAGFMRLAEMERVESGFAELHWSDLTDEYEYRVRIQLKPHKKSIPLPDPHPHRFYAKG